VGGRGHIARGAMAGAGGGSGPLNAGPSRAQQLHQAHTILGHGLRSSGGGGGGRSAPQQGAHQVAGEGPSKGVHKRSGEGGEGREGRGEEGGRKQARKG